MLDHKNYGIKDHYEKKRQDRQKSLRFSVSSKRLTGY